MLTRYDNQKLKLPMELSKELVELMGIHTGDGSLYLDKKYNYTIAYFGNFKKDSVYMDYVNQLFFQLFGVRLRKIVDLERNLITLRIRSKLLFYFYKGFLKISDGTKNNLSIHDHIKKNKDFLAHFIKGLFDTDGCVTLQKNGKYKYILIKISTKHKELAKDVSTGLNLLGIRSFVTTTNHKTSSLCHDVVIRNNNTRSFFRVIGSNNPRNIKKFEELKKVVWGRQDLNF